ncbi:hypothetical protein LTS08_008273 [Lithohypha guttulata]|uniref:Globin-sensor domain-containing protein n=1 Tax=Lithohypha guttulata TaxID=1690604 RepID=A0AAN7YBI6_9EURO|nr:hypothetical protein LTR05_004035 [Lithohypha guttulata]KAK5095111.1 hypothetical protein LTS08_008273 [Lithohypha guttulata]
MNSLPRDMQHISRNDLDNSLPCRIAYLQEFLEFGPDDIAALTSGQRYIKLIVPAIVNMVYKKLLRHDITARVFSTRDSRNETDPEMWVKEESPQIQNRKMFLRWYLTRLNSDPSKMEYWEYLDMVGAMHVGKGRRYPLFVDYIFLGACLGYIQDAFLEAILSHPRLELDRKIAIVKAIAKVIWIQNDLMARWHIKSGDGGGEMGDDAQASRSVSSFDSEQQDCLGQLPDEDTRQGSVCPFSGLSDFSDQPSLRRHPDMPEQRCPMSSHQDVDTDVDVTWERPNGIPKLRIVAGEVVGKEKLDLSILKPELERC